MIELPKPPHPIQRIVYFGTPDAAVPPLQALHAAGFEIPLVVTKADARRGRGKKPQPCPVKKAAIELGLAVTDDPADAIAIGAGLGVVVAYGRILRNDLLKVLPLVNIHFSLLPRWRGAAPVERAILAGDTKTGVGLMVIEPSLDTGAIYAQAEIPLETDQTAAELRQRLSLLGSDLLVDTLRNGLPTPTPQKGEATHAAKLTKADLKLDWTEPAVMSQRRTRIGKAWTTFRGKRLVINEAVVVSGDGAPGELRNDTVATGDQLLQLIKVQPEGKKPMQASDWLRGARPEAGEKLG